MGTGPTDPNLASQLLTIMLLDWISFAIFIGTLIVIALVLVGAFRDIKHFRKTRVMPLISSGKDLARHGGETAAMMMVRGKSIAAVGSRTFGLVGDRTQTTARLLRGSTAEAKQLPGEVAASSRALGESVKHTAPVRAGARALVTLQTARTFVQNIGRVARTIKGALNRNAVGPETNPNRMIDPLAASPNPPTIDGSRPARDAAPALVREPIGAGTRGESGA
jgi:hypothetical protein